MALQIANMWAVGSQPSRYVIELLGKTRYGVGRLVFVDIQPMRNLTEKDFKEYSGSHPSKLGGTPVPDYLLSFYGLEKTKELASEFLRIRLTQPERQELETKAKELNMSLTEYGLFKLFDGKVSRNERK